jgi:hypothetical protein
MRKAAPNSAVGLAIGSGVFTIASLRNNETSNRFFTSPPQWAMICTDGSCFIVSAERNGLSQFVINESAPATRETKPAAAFPSGTRAHHENLPGAPLTLVEEGGKELFSSQHGDDWSRHETC